MRILVTHCHSRMGYAVARSLIRFGQTVIAGGTTVPTMCHHLPGVEGEFAYPEPFKETDAFVKTLEQRAAMHRVDLFFPVHEETFVVSYHRARLARAAQTLAPNFEALMRAHDKVNVPARAHECCIPVPHTVVTNSTESLRDAVAQVGLPAVLKPRFGSGADETRIVRDRQQLDSVLACQANPAVGREVLVQSYFDGVGIGFAGLVWEGRVFALSGHRRLREIPTSGGTSTARTTFDHQEIRDATERLLPRLGIDGVVMAEYRYNSATGAFCLLELNPRYWGGVPTAIESGVDFPVLHLEAALGRPAPSVPLLPSRQVEGRWLLGEARALVELVYHRRWREAGAMFCMRRDRELYWDDMDWWRPAAFFHQTRAYYNNLKRHGSFGGHCDTKAAFFARAAAEVRGVS